jgi:hypothetical protein
LTRIKQINLQIWIHSLAAIGQGTLAVLSLFTHPDLQVFVVGWSGSFFIYETIITIIFIVKKYKKGNTTK